MRIRCGRCTSEFEVPGPGQFSCPTCGTVNQVGGGAMPPPVPGAVPPPPTPAPSPPPPSRVTCDVCGYSFAVGDIAVAVCPNCTAEVTVPDRAGDTPPGPGGAS
jgi:Zn finger protein HypA/HybF involved in hydrogenase expression